MRLLRVICGLTVMLALGVVPHAQTRPNFSGQWVQISPDEGAGVQQLIKHDATTLVTIHDSEGGEHNLTYKLDGSEQRNVLSSHGTDLVTLYRAAWQGNALVISSSTTYPDGRTMTGKDAWTMDAEGRLVVDLERNIGGQEIKMKLIHKKVQ